MERPNKEDYNLDSTSDSLRLIDDQNKYISYLEFRFLDIKTFTLNGNSEHF